MVSVCEPGGASPSSDGSDSEGQHTSEGIVAGSRPAAPRRTPSGAGEYAEPTCSVPAKATAGSMPDLSRGSRSSSRLIFSCAPSGFVSGSSGSPSRMCSTHGATFASTNRASTVAGPPAVSKSISLSSSPARIAETPAPTRISAPGRRGRPGQRVAERAHAAQRAPAARRCRGRSAGRGSSGSGSSDGSSSERERPDQRVGRHDAAHGVVGEPLLDHLAQRRGDEVAPGRLVHVRGQVLLPAAAAPGASARPPAPSPPPRSRSCTTRRTRGCCRSARGTRCGCACPPGCSTSSPRCRPSRTQGVYDAIGRDVSAHVELELGHQPGRHQRDQVRVARDPRRAGPRTAAP